MVDKIPVLGHMALASAAMKPKRMVVVFPTEISISMRHFRNLLVCQH
jgi:hypothetical protein